MDLNVDAARIDLRTGILVRAKFGKEWGNWDVAALDKESFDRLLEAKSHTWLKGLLMIVFHEDFDEGET